MIKTSNSVTIMKPVEEVFGYTGDLSNDPAWHTDILAARQTSAGPIGEGTTFHIRFKPFMGQSEGDVTVTGYEPSSMIQYQGTMGPMRPTISYRFEPGSPGTVVVTRQVEMQPTGWMRLMEPIMKMMMGGQNAQFLQNLKQVLEKSPS